MKAIKTYICLPLCTLGFFTHGKFSFSLSPHSPSRHTTYHHHFKKPAQSSPPPPPQSSPPPPTLQGMYAGAGLFPAINPPLSLELAAASITHISPKSRIGPKAGKPYHDRPQSPSLSCHLTTSAIIKQVIKLNYVVLLFSLLFITKYHQISASPNITRYPAHLVSRPPGSGIEVKLRRRSCCRLPHFCLLLR